MYDKGEALETRERKVFGEHETIELPVAGFVRLPQVRSNMNPELPNLKDSIRTRGLINQIDVARMSADQLEAYINFVNQTWGTNVSIDDYALQQQPDENYYVVVAGHTRTEAVFQLQEEDEGGFEYAMIAKVHPISNPEEIIALQLDENLHSKPAQEQRAIAIVETYQYGLQNGLWTNKKEFLAQSHGKFSRRILDDAMGFAQLPPEARDFVFSGRLSYNAGVALGQATDTIIDYTAAKLGYDELPERATPEFNQAYRQQVGILIAGIANRSLNGTAAKKFVGGHVSVMQQQLERLRNPDDESALFEFDFVSAEEQTKIYLKQLEKEYREALREMRNNSIGTVVNALELHRRLAGNEGIDELEAERRRRTQLLASSTLEIVNA